MFLHFFIMKSQFVDPVTINSKEDVITFQNTGNKCHVPEMKRHSPVINQVSPPGVYQCLIISTRTGRQLLMAKFRKTTQRQVLPWKKNIFFTHRLKRKNNFSELYFYWENDEKIMEKSVFICQMIHVCVIGGISQSSC